MAHPDRNTQTASKLAGGFLFFVGVSAVWVGASVLFAGAPVAAMGTSCNALCGLTMLASVVLGPLAGQVVVGSLTLLAGLGLALVGRSLYDA